MTSYFTQPLSLSQIATAGGITTTSKKMSNLRGKTVYNSSGVATAIPVTGSYSISLFLNKRFTTPENEGIVITLAGNGSAGSTDSTGLGASFNLPAGVAFDPIGIIYVAETNGHKIRKITYPNGLIVDTGVVTTLAGSGLPNSRDDGTGADAGIKEPYGVAIDNDRNVIITDGFNCIRKVTPTGVVTTIAGKGVAGFVDSTGADAEFNSPQGVAIDNDGNIIVADTANNCIRKVTNPGGVVTTLAGNVSAGFGDGTGAGASFNLPAGVAIDNDGNIIVADFLNNRIRKVTNPGGVVTTLTTSQLNNPIGVAIDVNGDIIIADSMNNRIRKLTPGGVISKIAGSGMAAFADGTGESAAFNFPSGVAIDGNGNIFVGDMVNNRIRVIFANSASVRPVTVPDPPTNVTATAGDANAIVSWSTPINNGGATISFYTVTSSPDAKIAFTTGENSTTVSELTNGVIYTFTVVATNSLGDSAPSLSSPSITPSGNKGIVSTLAGGVVPGWLDSTGSSARFNGIYGVAVDASGNVFVADRGNRRIRMANSEGVVITLVGNGTNATWGGIGTAAAFQSPTGVALDSLGNLFVTDSGFDRQIRKIDFPNGLYLNSANAGYVTSMSSTPLHVCVDASDKLYISLLNGTIQKITFVNTVPNTSSIASGFSGLTILQGGGMAIDNNGDLFIAANQRISKINKTTLAVTTLAGSGVAGFADGTGTNAQFNNPTCLVINSNNTMFVTDQANRRIRKINISTSVVSTLAGSGTSGYSDGTGNTAEFESLRGIALHEDGTLYVTDSNRIRKIV